MADETSGAPSGQRARWAFLLASLLALSLVASVVLVPRVAAVGQPAVGFAESGPTDVETFRVMGADYSVRTNLTFGTSETLRVNVSSTQVDWTGNAAGLGSRNLALARFDGTVVTTVTFAQAAGGPPFVYSASLNLATLTFAPDAYYLRILIDDTRITFQASTPVRLGPAGQPHLLETFADSGFAHPSDVFTPTSTVWVRLVGRSPADPDIWDLDAYLNGATVVGGPNANFDNFQARGVVYTFSIDLTPYSGNLVQGWAYTLNVRLTGTGFDAGKQIQIFSPTVRVTASSLSPATARQGQTGVPILALSLSLDPAWNTLLAPAAFNLDRVRVTLNGTGVGADIAGIHLYDDVNGNGVVDAGDVLLASTTAPGGLAFPVWVGQAGVSMDAVSSSGPLHLIVTYDIAPGATVGDAVGARFANPADLDFEGTLGGIAGLPVASGNVVITAATILTVTNDPGIAPGTAAQGATNVAMDLLHLSTNGPAIRVSSISVTLAGTGTSNDISAVSLHVDNGNGIYEPTRDPLLGTPSAFTAGVATFGGISLAVDSVGRSVWVVYNVSATATVGDRVGSSLPTNASVTVTSGSVFGGTFPLNSGLVQITGPTLTVDGRSLAPAQAVQGRQNMTMLELTLTVDFGQSVVSGIRIDKRGSSVLDSDVPAAKVWLDNGDGLFDTGDVLLGSQGFIGGTTVIGGLSLTVSAAQRRVLFITYDLSATATTGVTVVARLAAANYVSVDTASTVDPGTFPIVSAPVLITAPGSGAFLSVGSVDMAQWTPQVYRGQTGVPMEKLYLSVDQNSGTVTGIRVSKVGTSTVDADVAAVKLYRDTDRSGNFSAGDQLLSTTSFVGGIAIFGNLNLVVGFNQPVMLFLVIDVGLSGTVGRTVALRLGNPTNIATNATTTVDPNSFPIDSSAVTISAASLHGTVRDANGNPIANATVTIPQLGRTATTDARGNYTFANLPVGSWYVVASAPGFDSQNRSASLTATAPDGVLNFGLTPAGTLPGGSTAAIVGGGLLALLVLGLLALFFVRRRSHCPVCGKAKPKDMEVCPECQAKGLHPPGPAGGNPPAAEPPKPPQPPGPGDQEL